MQKALKKYRHTFRTLMAYQAYFSEIAPVLQFREISMSIL